LRSLWGNTRGSSSLLDRTNKKGTSPGAFFVSPRQRQAADQFLR
jgi:hypothetical protein